MIVWFVIKLAVKILAAPAAWWFAPDGFGASLVYTGGVFGVAALITLAAVPVLYFGSRVITAHETRRRSAAAEVRVVQPLPEPSDPAWSEAK